MLIKAGTYRFNDVLSEPSADIAQELSFSCTKDISLDGSPVVVNAECSAMYLQVNIGYLLHYVYTAFDFTSDGVTESALDAVNSGVYNSSWNLDRGLLSEEIAELLSGFGQTITFSTEQEVSAEFYEWFTANTKPAAASIQYSGSTIANLFAGQKATLACEGMKMQTDVVVAVAENVGGGSCDKPHVIEVDELPTENIDESAVYLCGGKYYKYVEELTDVLYYEDGMDEALPIAVVFGFDASAFSYQYVQTKPTENIAVSVFDQEFHLYYVEDENDLFVYGDFEETGECTWLSFSNALGGVSFHGFVNDASEATENGLYALGGQGWRAYVYASGAVEITENGAYDVTNKTSVVVDCPSKAVCGTWRFSEIGIIYSSEPYWTENVNFTTTYNGETIECVGFRNYESNGGNDSFYILKDGTEILACSYGGVVWHDEGLRTVNFGEPQAVHKVFHDQVEGNATRLYEITSTEATT